MIVNNINLPSEFIERVRVELGSDYEKYIKSLNEAPVRGLRVNTKKITTQKFKEISNLNLEKLSFADDAFLLMQDDKIGNSTEHLAGLFYMQEPSSMIPVISSGIEFEKRPLKVLDLCASPGGKTGQIATRVTEDSIIFSNEIIKSRAGILFSNVERQGFKNVIVLNEEPQNLSLFEGYFDYVFVDAPCSGEGMFRKNPETINEWSLQNVELCASRQKNILSVAERLVCSGGKLIYSTCTFSREEDEEIVDWFTQNYNFQIEDVIDSIKDVTIASKAKSKNGEFARKFYPFSGKGEGQFVCVFKNLDEKRQEKLYSKKHFKTINMVGHNSFSLLKEFMENNLNICFSYKQVYEFGNNLYYVPKLFDEKIQTALDEIRLLTIGVKLGSVEKHRFEPNHSFFMAFYNDFKQKIEINDEALKKYLHGEELSITGYNNGYAVITNKNFAIGGGKIASNRIKNLYPKGLRI